MTIKVSIKEDLNNKELKIRKEDFQDKTNQRKIIYTIETLENVTKKNSPV